jgi:hypothetical protein
MLTVFEFTIFLVNADGIYLTEFLHYVLTSFYELGVLVQFYPFFEHQYTGRWGPPHRPTFFILEWKLKAATQIRQNEAALGGLLAPSFCYIVSSNFAFFSSLKGKPSQILPFFLL